MLDPIAALADEIDKLRRRRVPQLRVGTVTEIEATAEQRARLDITGTAWAATDTDSPLAVGDRVYALQQGGVWVVSGRLNGADSTTPIGAMTLYGGTVAPAGWLLCQGQSLARADYQALFSVLGTAYGSTSTTTFSLPDLQGRFPLGDSAARALGATGGSERVTLTEAQLAPHDHSMPHTHTVPSGAGDTTVASGSGATVASSPTATTSSPSTSTTSDAGGGDSHENMPPWIVVNYIIRAI